MTSVPGGAPHADSALSGVRVIEFAQGVAGPYCGKLLADAGAEVIKIEPPETGDRSRNLGPFPGDIPHQEKSGLYLHLNTNKKSVTLDIAAASGRIILKRLLAKADILTESYPPGHLAGLGLGYDDLKDELSELIYCSITPFGQTGPYRDYQANSIAAMALSGLMYVSGDPDREPLATGGYPADYFAALNAWVAVLAALAFREREGGGQCIDVSMLESLGSGDEYNTAMYSFMGAIRRRFYSRHLFAYPMDIYPCRDGHIVVVPGAQGLPTGMALLIAQPELETNMLFIVPWMRAVHWRAFDALVQPWLNEHDWQEILTLAQELRMPFGPVLDLETLLANAHLTERGFFQEIDHPAAGKLTHSGPPFLMSETPLQTGPAPTLGQHNEEVLSEAMGYQRQDLIILRERGII
jgi:crotonobetainyl-CoA:carnitine CoA-transferase CaiB-like acyl-CoA transferase